MGRCLLRPQCKRLREISQGPYAEAILRFQISFPDTYPSSPPLVTFSTDVFHPLVVPSTTYTFSANLEASSTVSASDEHRLPPGAFSLRYGFPNWFARAGAQGTTTTTHEREGGASTDDVTQGDVNQAQGESDQRSKPSSPESTTVDAQATTQAINSAQVDRKATLLALLHHIHASFTDPSILDPLPISSAGNPSAWHAWRAHRSLNSPTSAIAATGADASAPLGTGPATGSSSSTSPSSPKHPSAWKWDGVWESRVESAIRESIAESALFGSPAASGGPGAGLGLGFGLGGARGEVGTPGSRFASSPSMGGGGASGTAAAGGSDLDDRQRLQAIADRQIRFAKIPDDSLLDVRRQAGFLAPAMNVAR
ncbi:uncharacterized protein A1O9_01968 [Exophiala aquamarina CBS 119918]|uniref:UBC core domain-containing protein n=1 Tax=Exophiala aquamarina CBS 119918 TaxID=1182545 RepID=A0A072PKY7_9EURO|nr:uncharacterized protein A1O9_01968 [Exophiala aquamarina CBS 119918]KEF60407.1 hypothetical protein A1O9_01968 [Exophiala aquamarina CBS 119918]